jgi:hypothetical protein
MEIVGRPPELAGQLCEALVCEGFVYEGEIEATANVLYLRFEGVWHKLIIDYGTIFVDKRPTLPNHGESKKKMGISARRSWLYRTGHRAPS